MDPFEPDHKPNPFTLKIKHAHLCSYHFLSRTAGTLKVQFCSCRSSHSFASIFYSFHVIYRNIYLAYFHNFTIWRLNSTSIKKKEMQYFCRQWCSLEQGNNNALHRNQKNLKVMLKRIHTLNFSTSADNELILSVSWTMTGVSLMTGGASSMAFRAASRSLTTIDFASSTCTCMACNASCNLANSWAFASSRSICVQNKKSALKSSH